LILQFMLSNLFSLYLHIIVQLKIAISSLQGEVNELVALKLQGLTRQQMIQGLDLIYIDSFSLVSFTPFSLFVLAFTYWPKDALRLTVKLVWLLRISENDLPHSSFKLLIRYSLRCSLHSFCRCGDCISRSHFIRRSCGGSRLDCGQFLS
jgi:hypothetical protein